MEPTLTQFIRQYLQQLNELSYPAPKLLLEPYAQEQIFRYMFDVSQQSYLPQVKYQRRVLKAITDKILSAIEDPEKDEVSDSLMQHMAYLCTLEELPPAEAVQQKTIVSYFLPQGRDADFVNPILIEEARNLYAIGSNVGFRTWDACLRLACYLSTDGQLLVQDKNVIELGAGTGLLSILCAGHLKAASVLATDGAPGVVTSIVRNIDINADLFSDQRAPAPIGRVLDWSDLSELSEVLSRDGQLPKYSTILGSDITYNLDYLIPLVDTFDALEKLFPGVDIIIAGAIRNINTFNTFIKACSDKSFEVSDIPFEVPPFHQQKGFFHSMALPIRIVKITRTPSHQLSS